MIAFWERFGYHWLATLVLALWVTMSLATEECSSLGASSIVMSVTSKRNVTGHWNIEVDVQSGAQRRGAARTPERGLAFTLGQRTSLCNGTDAVHLIASASVGTRTPPAGYEPWLGSGGAFYHASASALTWADAHQRCTSDGAHLAIINNEREADVVREFFASKPTFKNHSSPSYVFLGLHDRYKEGEWLTVDGTVLTKSGYVLWDNGQPSGGSANNCGVSNSLGKFLSYPCTNKLAYICEFDA